MTRVVNKRHGDPGPNAVYCGRPGPWGNPVELGKPCPECDQIHTRADGAGLVCFSLIMGRRMQEPEYWRRLLTLEGKTLVCWCAPALCHCDLYAAILDACGERMALQGHLDRYADPTEEAMDSGVNAVKGMVQWLIGRRSAQTTLPIP